MRHSQLRSGWAVSLDDAECLTVHAASGGMADAFLGETLESANLLHQRFQSKMDGSKTRNFRLGVSFQTSRPAFHVLYFPPPQYPKPVDAEMRGIRLPVDGRGAISSVRVNWSFLTATHEFYLVQSFSIT